MTFHLFLFTITIKRRQLTHEEIENEKRINQIMEEIKDRKYSLHRHF